MRLATTETGDEPSSSALSRRDTGQNHKTKRPGAMLGQSQVYLMRARTVLHVFAGVLRVFACVLCRLTCGFTRFAAHRLGWFSRTRGRVADTISHGCSDVGCAVWPGCTR